MKIHLERTGGFAGLVSSATVDTGSLPSDEAHKVENMVQQANLFRVSPTMENPSKHGAADYFTYKITIEAEQGTKQIVQCTDVTMQPSIRPLIDYLGKHLKA